MSEAEAGPSPTKPSRRTSRSSPRSDPSPADLAKIGAGLEAVRAKTSPDKEDVLEVKVVDSAQAEHLAELIKDLQANRELKSQYATKVYRYLVGYSAFCAIVISLQGWKLWGFNLDPVALTVLVGSTAVAAIGLVGFVVQGLFKGTPHPNKKPPKIKKRQ